MANTTASNLLRSGAFRVVHTALATAVGFFMMPFSVTHLGEHWYGVWLTIGSIVANYYLLDVGLAGAVTRNVADGVAREDAVTVNKISNTALCIYLCIACVLLLVTVGLAAGASYFAAPDDLTVVRGLILVTGITLTINFPFNAFSGIIQARLRYDLLAMIQFVALVLTTTITIVALLQGAGVLALAYVGLGSAVFTNFLFLKVARRLFPALRVDLRLFDRGAAKQLFGYSMWSFFIQMAEQVRSRIDPLLVAGVFSSAMVTRYAAGARPLAMAVEFLYRATNFVTPLLTQLHAKEDHEGLYRALRVLMRINVFLVVFLAGMAIAVGRPFVERWMGADFGWSALIIYALVPARVVEYMLNPLDSALYATAQHRLLAITVSIEAVLKIGAVIVLIKAYGPVGVALGTTVATLAVRLFVTTPFSCRMIGIPLFKLLREQLPGLVVGAALMVAATHVAWTHLSIQSYGDIVLFIGVCGLVYVPVMLIACFDGRDRAVFARTLSLRWPWTRRYTAIEE